AGIRDYYSVFQWDWDAAPPRGKLRPDKIQEHLRGYLKNGGTSINAEASDNWGPRGLSYYLAAQLMWDVNTDSRALLHDFYHRAFGPAAPAVERYYNHWYGGGAGTDDTPADELGDAKDTPPDAQKLKVLFQDLDEAARLAKDRPDCLARIDHLRMYVHYLL